MKLRTSRYRVTRWLKDADGKVNIETVKVYKSYGCAANRVQKENWNGSPGYYDINIEVFYEEYEEKRG